MAGLFTLFVAHEIRQHANALPGTSYVEAVRNAPKWGYRLFTEHIKLLALAGACSDHSIKLTSYGDHATKHEQDAVTLASKEVRVRLDAYPARTFDGAPRSLTRQSGSVRAPKGAAVLSARTAVRLTGPYLERVRDAPRR